MIPFNKPFFIGKEIEYIKQAVELGKIAGNGHFTKKCHDFFQNRFGFKKVLLTTSCTDALEMAAIISDIKVGDEVIIPSYTFVTTANAFVLRGARIIFADSEKNNPNLDCEKIESLITEKTKAIVPVHYAGVSCDMDKIMSIAQKHNLVVIEDSAQGVDSFYKQKPLGGIGHLATFSFHETKNIISGEGGMLVINEESMVERAEVVWEKGTNRAAFFRGEIDKYNWVDLGSSFLPSELTAAFLYAQLENMEKIQAKRKQIWKAYHDALKPTEEKGYIKLPEIPDYATNNAHMFYILCHSLEIRTDLIQHLLNNGFHAVFHYISLHKSPFYSSKYAPAELPNADRFTDQLVRLPLFYELRDEQVRQISQCVAEYFQMGKSGN
jgi:dTDP-4-amino-4,6-dideoxygalactose transaminase